MTGARISKMGMILGWVVGMATSSTLFAQAAPSLTIYIPRKVALGVKPEASQFPQIGTVKLNVSVTSGDPIVFTVTDPTGKSLSFPQLDPTKTQKTLTFISGDTVLAQPAIDADHPYRYEIDFILRSNSKSDCTGTQARHQNTYVVAVRPADPTITNVCLDSYDGRYRTADVPINSCSAGALGANLIPIPLDDPADKVASFDPNNQPSDRCSSFPVANSNSRRGIVQTRLSRVDHKTR